VALAGPATMVGNSILPVLVGTVQKRTARRAVGRQSRLLDASERAVDCSWRDAECPRPAKPRLIRGRHWLSTAEGRRKVFVVHDRPPRRALLQVAACALVELPEGAVEDQPGEHAQRERGGAECAETDARPAARVGRAVQVGRLLPGSFLHRAPLCVSRGDLDSINAPCQTRDKVEEGTPRSAVSADSVLPTGGIYLPGSSASASG
jgi:hypothetical protein